MRLFGMAFIVIGVIGAIGVIGSFDWDVYNEIKDGYDSELKDTARGELIAMWLMAGTALVSCSAVGLLFLALDNIAHTLRVILFHTKDDKNE